MTSELKPCPFCLRPLKRSSGKFNPMAVCETDGCWMKEKQIAVPCDDPFSVKSWNTRAVPDVPELERVNFEVSKHGLLIEEFCKSDGKYVLHSQAAEIIAAKDKEIEKQKRLTKSAEDFLYEVSRKLGNAEAKLAQYEAQEPVAWMHPKAGWVNVSKAEVANHCVFGISPVPLYASPAPTASVVAKNATTETDLKAENEKLREAAQSMVAAFDPYNEMKSPEQFNAWSDLKDALNVEASNG